MVSTVAGERSVSNRFCCRKVTRSATPARCALSVGVLDPRRIEVDPERPRAEPAGGDGDAAVARSEVDHVVGGADLGDLQHAVHGLARGRNIDDVEALRVDIADREDADANQERGREHSPGDGRSSGLAHAVLVTFAAMSTIRFWQSTPLEIHDVRPQWQTPFASISAGISASRSPMTSRNSRSSGARRSRSTVQPIKLDELRRAAGLFARGRSARLDRVHLLAFLHAGARRLQGWALFCDCDFLLARRYRRARCNMPRTPKAVYCVQHDYRPKETIKMDGAVQTIYPRKNWSSLMLFNCDHPSRAEAHARTRQPRERRLSAPHAMGRGRGDRRAAGRPGTGSKAGTKSRRAGTPNAVHFTRGGPWFEKWQNVDYGDLWCAERDDMLRAKNL